MKIRWQVLSFIAILTGAALAGRGSESAAYDVQLIRGSDENQPPEPNCKPLPAEQTGTFRSVFKWKCYWQMSLQRIEIPTGRITRVRLNPEREVEIDLTNPDQRSVKAFYKGKLVQCAKCPRGEARTLIGGDRDSNSAWFIVINRARID